MTATPAQVANDLAAQGTYFQRRDDDVSRACRDAARMIRALLAGETVDGRTYAGLQTRLIRLTLKYGCKPESQIAKSLSRGLAILPHLCPGPQG